MFTNVLMPNSSFFSSFLPASSAYFAQQLLLLLRRELVAGADGVHERQADGRGAGGGDEEVADVLQPDAADVRRCRRAA